MYSNRALLLIECDSLIKVISSLSSFPKGLPTPHHQSIPSPKGRIASPHMAREFQDVQTHGPDRLPPNPTSHHVITPPFQSLCSVCSATLESLLPLITFSSEDFSALERREVNRRAPLGHQRRCPSWCAMPRWTGFGSRPWKCSAQQKSGSGGAQTATFR